MRCTAHKDDHFYPMHAFLCTRVSFHTSSVLMQFSLTRGWIKILYKIYLSLDLSFQKLSTSVCVCDAFMYPCMFSYADMLMCRALSQPTAPREDFKALWQHIRKQFWQAWEILSQDKRERELSKTKREICLTVTVPLNMYYSPERKAGDRRLPSEAVGIVSWILLCLYEN